MKQPSNDNYLPCSKRRKVGDIDLLPGSPSPPPQQQSFTTQPAASSSKSQPQWIIAQLGRIILLNGEQDKVVIGEGGHLVQRGNGNVRVEGNPQSIHMKAPGFISVYGNVLGSVTVTGMGNIAVHGSVAGNIEGSGVGTITVHGEHHGTTKLCGFLTFKVLNEGEDQDIDSNGSGDGAATSYVKRENVETWHYVNERKKKSAVDNNNSGQKSEEAQESGKQEEKTIQVEVDQEKGKIDEDEEDYSDKILIDEYSSDEEEDENKDNNASIEFEWNDALLD